MTKDLPTPEELRNAFDYDPETGHIKPKGSTRYSAIRDGKAEYAGYVSVRLNGRQYQAHRVIWAMAHGKWPDGVIDHINGIRSDNRLDNLRDVSQRGNLRNTPTARGVPRYKKIAHDKLSGLWRSYHYSGGEIHMIGKYHTKEDARKMYDLDVYMFERGL